MNPILEPRIIRIAFFRFVSNVILWHLLRLFRRSLRRASCLLLLPLVLFHALPHVAGESGRAFIIVQIVEDVDPRVCVGQHFFQHGCRVPVAPAVGVDVGVAQLLQLRVVVVPEDRLPDALLQSGIKALAY